MTADTPTPKDGVGSGTTAAAGRHPTAPAASAALGVNVVALLPMLPVRDAAYALSALAATTSAAGRAGPRFLYLLLAMTFPILDEGQ